jgi:hypothetical protein
MVLCWGGDSRMTRLSQLISESGWDCRHLPADQAQVPIGEQYVVLPVPTLSGSGRNRGLYGSKGWIGAEEILQALPKDSRVAAYLWGEEALRWEAARPDVAFYFIHRDEAFLEENAAISAEGALVKASQQGRCLFQSHCLVLGYGHLGRALCHMLSGLGARVSVAGRSGGSLQRAFFEGLDAWEMEGLPVILPRVDWIFNTIPSPVLGEQALMLVRDDCALMELASAPYGIDEKAARTMGLHYQNEGSIPGRMYPDSAAQAMMAAWLRARKQWGKE